MNLFLRIDINIISTILLGIVFFIANKRLDKNDKMNRIFLNASLVTVFQLLIETATCIINKHPGKWLALAASILHVCLFITGPLLTYIWCTFTCAWIFSSDNVVVKKRKILLIPFAINFILAVISPFTGSLFYINSANVYHRGPLFFVSAIITYMYLLYSFIIIQRYRKKLMTEEYLPLLLFGVLPAIGGLMQALFYGVLLMWSSAAFSFVIVFIFMQQRMMQLDTLTGAWTRGSFESYMEKKINNGSMNDSFGIIFVDLDKFKLINDTYGHIEGDMALKTAVQLIKSSLRKTDILARFGGDEFIILLDNITQEEINEIIQRIESKFSHYNQTSDKLYHIEYSCGYEIFDRHKHNINQFINYVDHLMYINKENKKPAGCSPEEVF